MSELLRTYEKSPNNKDIYVRNVLPHIINTVDALDARLKCLEQKQQSKPLPAVPEPEPEPVPVPVPEPEPEILRLDESLINRLEEQLESISGESQKIDNEVEELDEDDNCSVCTMEIENEIETEKQKIVNKEPRSVIGGAYKIQDLVCDGCVKKTLKVHKKEQKMKKKQEKIRVKEVKKMQRTLLKQEEALLKKKIIDLRKGRNNQNYALDEQMNEELKRKIRETAQGVDMNSNFNITIKL